MVSVRTAMKKVKAVTNMQVITSAEERQKVRMPLKEEFTPAMCDGVCEKRQMNARMVVRVLIVLNKEASAARDH